jgi:hypothetical protein
MNGIGLNGNAAVEIIIDLSLTPVKRLAHDVSQKSAEDRGIDKSLAG